MSDLRVTCTAAPGVFLVSEGDTVVATVNAGRVMAGKELAYAMAAAPELLSIVERFVALPSGAWHPERHAADEAELMTEARAAIAKARGEEA